MVKNFKKYKTSDVILLNESSFTHEQGYEIAKRFKKTVLILPDLNDFSSISFKEAKRLLRHIVDKHGNN